MYRAPHCCRNCTWTSAEEPVGSAVTWGNRGDAPVSIRRAHRLQSPTGRELERAGNCSAALLYTCLRQRAEQPHVRSLGVTGPFTSFTLAFHETTQAFEGEYIMTVMCSFCHNLTNDKLTQLGKGEAGMLTQVCLTPRLCPFHLDTWQRNSNTEYVLSGHLFFPCLIHIHIGSKNKPKYKRDQD